MVFENARWWCRAAFLSFKNSKEEAQMVLTETNDVRTAVVEKGRQS